MKSFKLDLKGDRDRAKFNSEKVWEGKNYRDHPSSQRRLKRGCLQSVPASKDVTRR